MDVDLFDFDLPQSAIALRPARPRDSARLLHVDHAGPHDRMIADLPALLRAGDLLILNNTRVLPLQLEARRGQARIELTLLESIAPGRWRAFARPARRLRADDRLRIADGFTARVEGPHTDGQVVLDFAMTEAELMAALGRHGTLPLPPYIRKHRAVDDQDNADYQTVLARHDGAVAAPTAGLHFTDALLQRLTAAGVEPAELTLHVGPGTFVPIREENIINHKMQAEYFQISPINWNKITQAKKQGQKVLAVGTTSTRVLETQVFEGTIRKKVSGWSNCFIYPGWEFRNINHLLTNFHLPKSTLFLLVSAFMGEKLAKTAYKEAIRQKYRFFSYGDAMLIL